MSNEEYTHQNYWQQNKDTWGLVAETMGLRETGPNYYVDEKLQVYKLTRKGFILEKTAR